MLIETAGIAVVYGQEDPLCSCHPTRFRCTTPSFYEWMALQAVVFVALTATSDPEIVFGLSGWGTLNAEGSPWHWSNVATATGESRISRLRVPVPMRRPRARGW